MESYKPNDFWETSHSAVPSFAVGRGIGVRHVGGGQSNLEAEALYRLRGLNASRVLRKGKLPPNPKIFELGSGGGYWVEFFRRLQPKLFVGSDLSKTAVQRLAELYPDYEFITMTPPEEAWSRIQSRGPYDLTLAIDVLYHVTDDKIWEHSLNQLCMNTAVFGLLLIADYFYEQPGDQPSKIHVKHRKMQSYLDVLDKHDFKIEAIQPAFYFSNRIVSGPWRDHNRLLSVILRLLTSNAAGLRFIESTDRVLTAFAQPMNPKCKTRFLLARKGAPNG
jgi:Methyltransferase domain